MKQILKKASELLDIFCVILAAIFFAVNVGDIVFSVFARYLFKSSPIWTEELARFSLIWMVMIGAVPALKRGNHMAIDVITNKLPSGLKSTAIWLCHFVFLGITGFMTCYGFTYALKMQNFITMGMGIPKTIPLMAVPAGMGLLFLQYILIQFSEKRGDL